MTGPQAQERKVELEGLGPDSLVWRRTGEWTLLLGAGRALILQVAHPTVAAGVGEHSDYAEHPWRRLVGTLDLFLSVIFGNRDEAGAQAGARLRELHKRIRGVDEQGRHYHALEPEAFHWVHATLLETMLTVLSRFGPPFTAAERGRFYAEMCQVGRLYGLRDRDMPPDWAEFRMYYDGMIADRLENSERLQHVIATVFHPAKPPVLPLPDALWNVAAWPASELMRLATVGLLPPVLRDRFGLEWSREKELALRAHAAAIRRLLPLVPDRLRLMPIAYEAHRRARLAA
jgi:uncharacterized protein (DUF2236 family)